MKTMVLVGRSTSNTDNLAIAVLLMAEIPNNQLRLVVFPIIYRVSYISGGAGFQPSTVSFT